MSSLHRPSTGDHTPIERHRSERGHAFYPPADVLAAIPGLYGTEPVPTPDKVLYLHYFTGPCDWWIAEYDPGTGDAFGYACLGDPDLAEWGYTNLADLEALYSPGGITPTTGGGRVQLRPRLLVELGWRGGQRGIHVGPPWLWRGLRGRCRPGPGPHRARDGYRGSGEAGAAGELGGGDRARGPGQVALRPVLLGCPDCGNPRLLLHVDTRIPVTVTQSAADPFDPAGYSVSRVDHSPAPALEPRPTGVQCTGCGWTTSAPNWADHLTPAGL